MKYGLGVWLMVSLWVVGCKKEEVFTYGVNDVSVTQPGAYKPNMKSDLELISIAYNDLFGSSITPDELESLVLPYQALGDKRLVIDMIILNFLNEPTVSMPTDSEMRADVDGFVAGCFRKFFVRNPSAFEQWFVKDLIVRDTSIHPEVVYYAFMTSNEYRHY